MIDRTMRRCLFDQMVIQHRRNKFCNHDEQAEEVRRSNNAHVHEHTNVFYIRDGSGHQVSGVVFVVKSEAEALCVVVEFVPQ